MAILSQATDWRTQLWKMMEENAVSIGKPVAFRLYYRGEVSQSVDVVLENGELLVPITPAIVAMLNQLPAARIPERLKDDKSRNEHASAVQKIRGGIGKRLPLNAYTVGIATPLYTDRGTLQTNAYEGFRLRPADLTPWLAASLTQRVQGKAGQQMLPINGLGELLYDLKRKPSKDLFEEDDDTHVDPVHPSRPSRNLIFFGPPGTGKSYQVQQTMAEMGVLEARQLRVTFHPESSYYDFVGSHRPSVGWTDINTRSAFYDADGAKQDREPRTYYRFEPGILSEALQLAAESEEIVVLLIEEINRANCAAVFGDIFQLLDRRADGWSQYPIRPVAEWAVWLRSHIKNHEIFEHNRVRLPPNLFLFATMNTSDQSLFPMDTAFRRRWQMQYVGIEHGKNPAKMPLFAGDHKGVLWQRLMAQLNMHILSHTRVDDKQLGPWFLSGEQDWISEADVVGKLLFYLWADVFREGPRPIFSSDLLTFEQIVSRYQQGQPVFSEDILQELG